MKKVFSIFLTCVFTAAMGANGMPVPVSAAEEAPVQQNGIVSRMISDLLGNEQGADEFTEMTMDYDDVDGLISSVPTSPQVLINNNDGAYRYRDYLDSNNAKGYDRFADLIAPSTGDVGSIGSIVIAFDTPVTCEVEHGRLSSLTSDEQEAFYDAIWSGIKPGMDSAFLDIPELFWIDPSKISAGSTSAGVSFVKHSYWEQMNGSAPYMLSIDRAYIYYDCYDAFGSFQTDVNEALDNINSYREQLEQAVERMLPEQDNRYNMLKKMHDEIALFTQYDNSLSYEFMSSPIGALVAPPVVCEGYAKGFKLLCDRLDIPCVCVFGNYDAATNAGHMWNYVQMEDGKWYSVDVTWDDYDGDYGIDVYYRYFLKGSKNNGKHSPDSDYGITKLIYPALSENDFDTSYYASTTISETTTTTTETTTTTTTTTTTATSTTTSETTTSEPETTTTVTEPETTTDPETTELTTTSEETTTTVETTTEVITTESETTAEQTTTTVTETTEATTTESETTLTEPETTAPVYDEGDVNHDGEVSIADVISCIRVVLGRGAYDNSCDVTGDNIVSVFDVILIKRLVFMPR